MKKLLLALALLVAGVVGGRTDWDGVSLRVQTYELGPTLWDNQKQFRFDDSEIDIQVRHYWDMRCKACWGDSWLDERGGHVEVLAQQDFPVQFPWHLREEFQKQIVKHEVLHFKLTELGVPGDVQDVLIHGLQPTMRAK